MKRIFTLVAVAAASLMMAAQAHAQFGIVAGLTSSKANAGEAVKDFDEVLICDMESTDAGLTYKIDLGAGFAIQPAVIYQVKGAKIESVGETTADQLKTGFVEIPVGIQWGPDLMAFRPYVFAEPFIGYQITSSDKGNASFSDWSAQAKNKFEYGFGLGGGIEIASHIQLSAQWFKNLGNMFGDSAKSSSEAWEAAKDVKNFQGIKVTLGILF